MLVREAVGSTRGWKNVTGLTFPMFFSEPSRRAKFSDKEEERSRIKDDGRGRASTTFENLRTRTTFM